MEEKDNTQNKSNCSLFDFFRKKCAGSSKTNWWRVAFSVFYFIVGGLIFYNWWGDFFYFEVRKNDWNIYRYYWCVASSCWGFAAIAIIYKDVPSCPFPRYVTDYPLEILAISALVFGGLHIYEKTSGFVFYYLAFALCFTLGVSVDKYYNFFDAIFGWLKPKKD